MKYLPRRETTAPAALLLWLGRLPLDSSVARNSIAQELEAARAKLWKEEGVNGVAGAAGCAPVKPVDEELSFFLERSVEQPNDLLPDVGHPQCLTVAAVEAPGESAAGLEEGDEIH